MNAAAQTTIPTASRFVLRNASVPAGLHDGPAVSAPADAEGCARIDIVIEDGRIADLAPARTTPLAMAGVDLEGRQVWPAFIDMHTHLDKGHVIPRIRPDGTLSGGLSLTLLDGPNWTEDEMRLRMEFGVKCAYAHGVAAIRSHLDSVTLDQSRRGFKVLGELRDAWAGRVDLQGVAIPPTSTYLGQLGSEIADLVAASGGVLGGFTDTLERGRDGTFERLDESLDRMFALATERGLDIDLHVDQTQDTATFTIPNIARARLRSRFQGRLVLDHCVNLSLQPDGVIESTLDLAREADLGFVSLPTPMMYLMDRAPHRTPRWRGVTAAKEIMAAGLPLAVGGDNCRDAWFPYGDHDMLDTLKQAIRVFQADEPFGAAFQMATRTPAMLIGRPDLGRIAHGVPANLVIFSARSINALLCRDQADRIVLSAGRRVTDPLPAHHELEAALGLSGTDR